MIKFSLIKKSKKSRARLGILKTPHGEVETPSLVPVATLATIKGMRSDEVLQTKSQMLISNTYHLHLQPGENVVKAGGGLNKFMQWPRPTMTDSGGFQVFSLGFGRDLGVGKFLPAQVLSGKIWAGEPFPTKLDRAIEKGVQPTAVKITDDGVHFKSPTTGQELFLGPKESMAIQGKIGADIIFAFDECTPPRVTYDYMKKSLELTHRWAKASLKARTSMQALYGIVQGSVYKDLREESARYINSLDFDGFGIGGDLGDSVNHVAEGAPLKNGGTKTVLDWTLPLLDERKPRHLLGIGHLGDIENIIKCGVDTFDCTVPTHYARRGIAFINPASRGGAAKGRLDFRKVALLKDHKPIDPTCECLVCQKYQRSYIAHLIRANEVTGGSLITFHNLFFFNTYIEKIREKIKKGLI